MTQKIFRDDHELDSSHDPLPSQGVPGKVPVTARLAGRQQHNHTTNIVFRVESAEAARELASGFGSRDNNGVAAGADAAIDRAAASSSRALPDEVRDRFESSLGTDLSSVRVHTGSESQSAATAVGARAYTVGQNIHFGAGQYDPSSAFGMHLLAHEVAHTVQQQGATPTRQNKLEVSTPQDGAEHEADRAADAMVSMRKASVVPASGLFRQPVMRKTKLEDKLVDEANENEVAQATAMEQNKPLVSTLTTVDDASAARKVRARVVEGKGELEAGMSSSLGRITNDHVAANTSAAEKLDVFVGASGAQESTLGNFQASFERLACDFVRLKTQMHLVIEAEGSSDAREKKATEALHDTSKMNDKFKNAAKEKGSTVATNKGAAEKIRLDMVKASSELGISEAKVAPVHSRLMQANAKFRGTAAQLQGEKVAAEIATIKGKIDSISQKVDLVGSVVKTATKVGGAVATGGLTAKDAINDGVGLVVDIAKYAVKQAYSTELTALGQALGAQKAIENATAVTEAGAALDAAMEDFVIAGNVYIKGVDNLFNLKKSYREAMSALGQATDAATGGSGEFAIAAELLGEADCYLAQSTVTIDLGMNHGGRADKTNQKANDVNGFSYYNTTVFYSQGEVRKEAVEQRVSVMRGANDGNSFDGPGSALGKNFGANDLVKRAVDTLSEQHAEINGFAGSIRAIFTQAGSGPK